MPRRLRTTLESALHDISCMYEEVAVLPAEVTRDERQRLRNELSTLEQMARDLIAKLETRLKIDVH